MRKEGYCAFGAKWLTQKVQHLHDAMAQLDPNCLQAVEGVLGHAHALQTGLTLFRACYPKRRVALWKRRLRRVLRALHALRDTLRLIQWAEQLAPPREHQLGVQRAVLRLRQAADAEARTLQRAWARWIRDRVPNEIAGLSRRWVESFSDEPPDPAYAQQQWHSFYREQLPALHAADSQSLEVRCGRLRALLEGAELLPPLLPITLEPPIADTYATLETQRFQRWAVGTLQSLIEAERARTLAYAGHLRGFARLQRGMEWLLTQLSLAGSPPRERESCP